jgi:hypothetical protein
MSRMLLATLCALACTPFFARSGALLHAQTAPAIFYAQAFRQGSTKITEQTFEVKLDPQNPLYRQHIKDARGKDRYVLIISPEMPEGDNKITSWQAKLTDLQHAIYDNILLASQEPSSDPANNLWWLNPHKFAPVPITTKRIIKVDAFYVTFEVKSYHFTPLDSPYLDFMTVQVKFSNTDPRPPAP